MRAKARNYMNIYELAARLGVSVGVVLDMLERRVLASRGYIYEQRIPIFDDRDEQAAREWLELHDDRLALGTGGAESEPPTPPAGIQAAHCERGSGEGSGELAACSLHAACMQPTQG